MVVEEEVVEVLNSQTGSLVSGVHQLHREQVFRREQSALNFWLSLRNSDISIPIPFYLLLEAPVAV